MAQQVNNVKTGSNNTTKSGSTSLEWRCTSLSVQNIIITSLDSLLLNAGFHAQTLLLFTSDQIFDTIIPGTAFGFFAALSGSILDLPDQGCLSVLKRVPLISLWLWILILQFCIQNQRGECSVEEDAINKPWRPIPSGRMTSEQAEQLLMATHFVAFALSYELNVTTIFIVYTGLITAYNDYGGGNVSGVVRNLFCGAGFSCYFGGALDIAIGSEAIMSRAAWKWVALVAIGILATSIQTQEFRDEAGDTARGRRTLVTELGRKPALCSVLITVSLWSVFIPFGFFHSGWKTASLPLISGATLLATTLKACFEEDGKLDRKMYKIWCLWMFGFCPLPLLASVFV